MREPILTGVAVATVLLLAVVVGAKPPPPPRTMPGQVQGKVESRWLAPFVSVTHRSIGKGGTLSVQWLGRDGKVTRELSGPNVDGHPGYVLVFGQGSTIHAVNGSWQFQLPAKAGPAGYITATEDSRTFVHQFHPRQGEIAADVYVLGKLAGTVGPFPQYQGQSVELGEDGSLALLTKMQDEKTPQVVVAGPDGKLRFRVDCDGPSISPAPAPDGAGVLVRTNAGGDARNTFTFYDKSGKVSSLNIGPNAGLFTWLPGGKALMHTSIGYDYRFHLIDWATGKRLWEIADANPARVPGALPSVAANTDRILIGGREYVRVGPRDEPVRSLYAVDAETGRVVAHWLPSPLRAAASDGRFLRLGDELHYLTDDEFAIIDFGDIAGKANGWR